MNRSVPQRDCNGHAEQKMQCFNMQLIFRLRFQFFKSIVNFSYCLRSLSLKLADFFRRHPFGSRLLLKSSDFFGKPLKLRNHNSKNKVTYKEVRHSGFEPELPNVIVEKIYFWVVYFCFLSQCNLTSVFKYFWRNIYKNIFIKHIPDYSIYFFSTVSSFGIAMSTL